MALNKTSNSITNLTPYKSMANLLNYMEVGNPLINFELWDDYDDYNEIKDDRSLVDWYHQMLEKHSHRPLVISFLYAMMSHAVDTNIVFETNETLKILEIC